jgi:hypothetical protein
MFRLICRRGSRGSRFPFRESVDTLVLVRQCLTRSNACQNSAHSTAASSGPMPPSTSPFCLHFHRDRLFCFRSIYSASRWIWPLNPSPFHKNKTSASWMRNADHLTEFVSSVPVLSFRSYCLSRLCTALTCSRMERQFSFV